jgi:hypothetical protein
MKQKIFTCLLLIFTIYMTLLSPFISVESQVSNDTETEPKGLQFRLREGSPSTDKRESPTPVPTTKLSASEAETILRRLPDLPVNNEDKTDFKLRPDSLPPPKKGNVINVKFPSDETQNAPKVNASKTLEIIRFSPENNVPLVSDLSVTFSQPMIAVTSQEQAAENVPVKLTPNVKGQWRWLGTTTLIFDAETHFPMATKFTAAIPAGTKSPLGQTLAKDFSWTFSTPPPKLESFSFKDFSWNSVTQRPKVQDFRPKDEIVGREEIFLAFFNQKISAQSALNKISATANGQKISLLLATENEITANEELTKKVKDLPKNRWLAFRPAESFPPETQIKISFEKGIPSAEGSLTSTDVQDFTFQTYGTLKFNKFICSWDERLKICPRTYPWRFEFNNSLDEKSFDKSGIKIEPQVEDWNFNIYGNQLVINAATKPRTDYTVTISKSIKDKFGQTLGNDVTVKFTMAREEAHLYSSYNELMTLDPNAKPTFSFQSTNYNTLRVRIYAVKAEDYPAFLAYSDNEKAIYPTFGKMVFYQTVKVKNIPDEQVETKIDISPALNNGIGHAVLVVEPPNKSSDRIVKWVQATNIGLDAFSDREQLAVFASNLKDGKPLGNVQISLSNGAGGVSQENGIANIKLLTKPDKRRIYLIAREGNDSAILTGEGYYNWDDEDFESGWISKPPKDKLRWFVFDDRKIYRPGETVSIKGYLRKVTGGRFSDVSELADSVSDVSYVLKDAQDVQIAKGMLKLNAFGAFDLQSKIPENINLGYQRLELTAVSKLSEAHFTHNFQVQEFRRPEFEVETSVESSAPFYLGDSATLLTQAKYFSGGGLANADTNWNVSAMPTNYTPPNREDFNFGKFTPWWESANTEWNLRTSEEFKGQTDIEGKHRVALDFLKANPTRPYSVEARAGIQDVNRQTFSSSTTLLVHPSKLYVGLRTPKTFVQSSESFKIETITTDIDGQAVTNAPVTVKAEMKGWQQVKGEWQQVVIDTQKCEIKSAKDVVSCSFTAKQGGTYTVTASVLDEKERRNESELTVWVAGGNRETSLNVSAQTAELIPNKKEYAPGETAEILVNAPFYPAEGVMILERNGILKTERFSVDKSSTVLKIPLEESYLPNVHVQVTLVGASPLTILGDERDQKLPKRSAYATGELNLDISTASRKLNVTAEPFDKTLEPGGKTKVNIAVKDNNENPVANSEVALVAVDESILALTNYKIDNPLDVFYEKLEANTSDTHSREDVLLNLDGIGFGGGNGTGDGIGEGNTNTTANSGREPFAKPVVRTPYATNTMTTLGNATANAANTVANMSVSVATRMDNIQRIDESPPVKPNSSLAMMKLRRNFAALAIFAPSVKTDAEGRAVVEVQLPDNLTRYRITAVAVTKSKQFGLGESNVTAKYPLMLRPSAPRFMNFGDKIELPVVLQNQTDKPMTISVAVRSNNATLTDGNGRKATIPANNRAEIRFPVTAEKAGIARFQIGATGENFADAAEIELPVLTPATSEAFATYGTTDQNGAIVQPIVAPKDVYSQFGGLEITSSSTQLQELTDAFIYLQNYPFECTEQISSRILSVTALRDVLTAFNAKDLPTKTQIEAKMKSDIERLQKLQHADGGFSFWRNDDESFPFVTVHVAHALARAKAKGYAVPKETLAKTLNYLKTIETKLSKKKYSQESRWVILAYALYVRDLLGNKDAIKAKQILQQATLEKLSPESIGWILSVLATDKTSAAQVETIKRHLLNRVTETADKAHFVTNYSDGEYVLLSSDQRADGVILEALLKSGSNGGNATVKERVNQTDNTLTNVRVSALDLIPKIVRGLLANKLRGRWATTQENVFILLALDKYFQTYEKVTPDFVAKV